jgi:hypothetical protein
MNPFLKNWIEKKIFLMNTGANPPIKKLYKITEGEREKALFLLFPFPPLLFYILEKKIKYAK